MEVAELKKRLKLVAREFHGVKNVRVHTDLPKWAYVQALLARGDRRVADMLVAAQEHGWNKTFRTSPINPDFFTLRERRADELFPWDFIDHGISKEYLWEEYQRALEGKETPPCQPGSVHPLRGLRREGAENDVWGRGQRARSPTPSPPPPPIPLGPGPPVLGDVM